MADFSSVPVIDVHTGNVNKVWPMLMSAVKSSMFIALDIEMSGLGNRKKLFVKDMDDRYKNMCDVAKTRSIIAMGISCFQYMPLKDGKAATSTAENCNFLVQTFNLMLLSTEPYTVDPVSLKFLLDHGFNFNMQYACGLPYTSSTKSTESSDMPSVQRLFDELLLNKIPLVLHNGLMDLVFIYQCFHCQLPGNMSTFVTDLSNMFSGGLYDTKFLAEFQARISASYLEYVFRKCQRNNMDRLNSGLRCVTMSFLSFPTSPDLNFLPCGLHYLANSETKICENYANHGWCAAGPDCTLSHDVDLIIDKETTIIEKKRRKRRRKRGHGGKEEMVEEQISTEQDNHNGNEDSMDCSESQPETNQEDCATDETMDNECNSQGESPDNIAQDNPEGNPEDNRTNDSTSNEDTAPLIKEGRTGGHRAGFDAFMTGFAFAVYMATFTEVSSLPESAKIEDFDLGDLTNKLSLSGKDIPLQIMQSSFSKPSKAHKQRMEKLRSSVK